MNSLEECVIQAELFDLRFGGPFFTWSKRRNERPILRKIDRVLVNADWEGVFSGSEAQFLPSGVSDHSPMIMRLSSLPRSKKAFKFFDYWANHPRFLSLVEKVWKEDVVGSPMFLLCSKLKINSSLSF